MPIETSYTFRASAKGFAEVAREIDNINKKVVDGEKAINRARDERPGNTRPSNVPGATTVPNNLPRGPARPAVVLPPGVQWRPGYGPKVGPGSTSTGRLPAPDAQGDPSKPKAKRGIKGDPEALKLLDRAYKRVNSSAERLVQTVMDVNSAIDDGLPSFREFAGLYKAAGGGRGGPGGGAGGGGGSGGGGGPRLPTPPAPPPGGGAGRGALLQGLLEGILPGIGMLQRGEGLAAQFGGRLLGGAARGIGQFGRDALMAPLHGVSGVQNAISGIPVIGGILGGATGQMFGNAGSAIGFEGQQMSALPYLRNNGIRNQYLGKGLRSSPSNLTLDQLAYSGYNTAGMNMQQSQQFLTSIAQASGGTADDPDVANMTNAGLSAFSRFGVGPEVAGVFGQGARLQGGAGTGQQGLLGSLAYANRGLGLEGTELQDYMRQMAEDIASFKDTGIPLRTDTIGALGSTLASSGIVGARAGSIANSFVRNAQNVGMEGPQSVEDFALLQASAGRPLKGIDDTLDAMENLEQGQTPQQANRTFRNLRNFAKDRYGNDRKGQFQQRQFLGRFGVKLNSKEFRSLDSGINGGLSGKQLADFNQNLNQGARDNVSSVIQRQSGLDNANLNLGMKGLDSYFAAEQTSKAIAAGVVEGINPYVKEVTKAVTGLYSYVLNTSSSFMASSPSAGSSR